MDLVTFTEEILNGKLYFLFSILQNFGNFLGIIVADFQQLGLYSAYFPFLTFWRLLYRALVGAPVSRKLAKYLALNRQMDKVLAG